MAQNAPSTYYNLPELVFAKLVVNERGDDSIVWEGHESERGYYNFEDFKVDNGIVYVVYKKKSLY